MHPRWLSNAYVAGLEPGGAAVFVDSGAPLEPLFEVVERERLVVMYLLTTHGDADHVEHDADVVETYRVPIATGDIRIAGLEIEALPTPGHADDHLAYVVNGQACFSGDVLFRDAVGGGNLAQIRHSVMDVLMKLPHDMPVYPGHTDETTIGREWEHNPFIRVWRGAEPEGTERVRVGGRDATLIVWSPDYDGKGKAWVRYEDGTDAIVGGSRVERLTG
jgi:glyoxylase-like metal-dependent hydrolase (beta-lactamase superfamily II)